jgi:hypothetical protein
LLASGEGACLMALHRKIFRTSYFSKFLCHSNMLVSFIPVQMRIDNLSTTWRLGVFQSLTPLLPV